MVIQGEVQYLELSWQLSRNAAAELPKKQGCTTRTGTHQGIDQGLLMLAAYKVYLQCDQTACCGYELPDPWHFYAVVIQGQLLDTRCPLQNQLRRQR